MTRMGHFYLETKEEYETATESINGLDDELQVSSGLTQRLEEKNSQLKKKVKILKEDFSHLTEKKGRKG
jgi:predicted  nucleic acid-binding Zn-ribbon protein